MTKRIAGIVAGLSLLAATAQAGDNPYRSAENLHTVSSTLMVLGMVGLLTCGGLEVAAFIDYDNYKKSTSPSDAEHLRKEVQTFDGIARISGIAGGVLFAGGLTTYIIYRNKISSLEKSGAHTPFHPPIELAAAPLPEGGTLLALRAHF